MPDDAGRLAFISRLQAIAPDSPLSQSMLRSATAQQQDVGAAPVIPGMNMPPADPIQLQAAQRQQDLANAIQPPTGPTPSLALQAHPGMVKQYLMNFFHGFGDSILAQLGMPNPYQRQRNAIADANVQATTAHTQAETDLMKTMVAVPNPNGGGSMLLPLPVAQKLFPALINANTKRDTTQMTLDSRESEGQANRDSRESENQLTRDSRESMTAARLQNTLQAVALRGDYSLRRAAISASAGAGGTVEDYLPAVKAGLPINLVPPRLRGQVLGAAGAAGLNPAFQKLAPTAQRMLDSISELSPVLEEAQRALAPVKNNNSFGDRMQGLYEGGKYAAGFATDDPVYSQINKIGNMVKVLGATPYTTVGRGKYLFDEIQKHLPRPGVDTPQLMNEKVEILHDLLGQMQEHVLQGNRNSLSDGGGPASSQVPAQRTIPTPVKPKGDGIRFVPDKQ